MNILRLIRFPVVCLAISGVLAGFYTVLFSGLGVEKVGYLPHVLIIGGCLAFAVAAWNELFCSDNSTADMENSLIPNKISMSMGFVVAGLLMIIALMLSMTVSILTFFIVGAIILNSFIYNALLKEIPLVDPIFFALQYTLVVVLGMSAHSYMFYLFTEPTIYLPLVAVFLYVITLRVLVNVSVVSIDDSVKKDTNDFERDSLELSTEIDSIYPGHIDSERDNDFEVAKKISDKMIVRNLSVILPEPVMENSEPPIVKELMIKGVWGTYLGVITLFIIPFALCYLYSFNFVVIAILALFTVFMIFPVCSTISKRNVSSITLLYKDGVMSIALLNAVVIALSSNSPYSKQTLTVVSLQIGITLLLLILKKYFKKII